MEMETEMEMEMGMQMQMQMQMHVVTGRYYLPNLPTYLPTYLPYVLPTYVWWLDGSSEQIIGTMSIYQM